MTLRMRMREIAALVVLAGLGCGDQGPEMAIVTGTVTLDGEPVEGAALMFVPEEGSTVQRPSFAATDAEGRYEAKSSPIRDGVPIGTCAVRITTSEYAVWKGQEYYNTELFPAQYGKGTEVITITSGANEYDFACESRGRKPRVDAATATEEGI